MLCQHREYGYLGFEVFTAVTMNNTFFWDVAPSGFIINRRSEETCRTHLQGRRNNASVNSTLKMEVTSSSETSVYNKATRLHSPDDGILYTDIVNYTH
jgi:hypothetical protein